MIKLKQFLGGLICALCGWMLTACSSDEANPLENSGKGIVSLSLSTKTDFGLETRAIDDSYSKVENYTVQFLKGNEVEYSSSYNDLKDKFIPLENGPYTVKAFYGTEEPASTAEMYVEGSDGITLNNDTVSFTLTCTPKCAKVVVDFSEDMPKYFSEYNVKFETSALKANEEYYIWEKDFSNPVYLRMDQAETVKATISLTKISDNKTSSIEKEYKMIPAEFKTIHIKPVVNTGNVGIEITIDETTNDHEVDIEVPSDWI